MKILQVIHGYPLRYNAGSEVYTQNLCHALTDLSHEVAVFTREENPYLPTFTSRIDHDYLRPEIKLYLTNMARERDGYRYTEVDDYFREIVNEFQPDVVHIEHLNHLSTSLIQVAADLNVPIIYTLHDFWLMCPRGQFLQNNLSQGKVWELCDGQDDQKCAQICYSRYFGKQKEAEDLEYWTRWVARRMDHIRSLLPLVSRFISPSQTVLKSFLTSFDIPLERVLYLDYGFKLENLKGRARTPTDEVVFGYIGTHIPAKGIDILIQAFGKLTAKSRLLIFGRSRGWNTEYLQRLIDSLPEEVGQRIKFKEEYENREIVSKVFNHIDAIVVPSIWAENSPLVIHEAQQCGVPVITANYGGMAEYVHHEVNGLLFKHRDVESLTQVMQYAVSNPHKLQKLGSKRYLYSESGDIPSMQEQAVKMTEIYQAVINEGK